MEKRERKKGEQEKKKKKIENYLKVKQINTRARFLLFFISIIVIITVNDII